MGTHIHVSGLSYFCTDDNLRQAFIPFGTVVCAQVVRDECGHSLGLGIVQMACSEDVERVFNVQHLFEVSGSRVDVWEPAEPEDLQGERRVVEEPGAPQTGNDRERDKSWLALQPLAAVKQRLIRTLVPSFWTFKH